MKKSLIIFAAVLVLFGCSDDSSSQTNNTTTNNNENDAATDFMDSSGDTLISDGDVEEDVQTNNTTESYNRLLSGIKVDGVSVFQAVEIPLILEGLEVSELNAPIITERDALFTVNVSLDEQWQPQTVTAVLTLRSSGIEKNYTVSKFLSTETPSETDDPSFSFSVDGTNITPDTTWYLRFTSPEMPEIDPGVSHEGRFPSDGVPFELGALYDGGGVNLVIVPVEYNIDGSGRMPDVSAEQLQLIEEMFLMLYPVANLNLTVRDYISWPLPGENPSSFDFGDMNEYLRILKEEDNAAQDVYYYAMVNPDETFEDYCSGTCTTGQSYKVTSPENGSYRVGTGVGFSGERWVWTLLHEMGHMHGRGHTNCGTLIGVDWSYPYSGGKTGVWGYNINDDTFLDPNVTNDYMGYCDDQWVSDYNYDAIFTRVIAVRSLGKSLSQKTENVLLVNLKDMSYKWAKNSSPLLKNGTECTLTLTDSRGKEIFHEKVFGITQSHSSLVTLPVSLPPWLQKEDISFVSLLFK
ncbi:MAG: hypothetical protein JXR95_11570 [Deltaproteobacteria bacterium]|nr:hypothetical protein [Deltaproteobacteria bacterium]